MNITAEELLNGYLHIPDVRLYLAHSSNGKLLRAARWHEPISSLNDHAETSLTQRFDGFDVPSIARQWPVVKCSLACGVPNCSCPRIPPQATAHGGSSPRQSQLAIGRVVPTFGGSHRE